MTMTPFNDGWTLATVGKAESHAVTLPHDAMLAETRSASAATGPHGGHFPGGHYIYSKIWTPPEDAAQREWNLFFEGVYGSTEIRLNGAAVATSISGYREFTVALDATAGPVHIEIDVDNTAVPNSRWYTGSGIYRKVWIRDVATTHIAHDGVRVRTSLAGADALVDVDISVEGIDNVDGAIRARVTLTDPDGQEFSEEVGVKAAGVTVELLVPNAHLWSDLSPDLYTLEIVLLHDGASIDQQHRAIGLRTIEVDATHGLRINGNPVLLRGACVHHDNGVIGAATFRAAEYRRVRILKESGFNAVRSSHNPLSRDFIDACDELGLYVIDELTDIWFGPKTAHDLAHHFDELWRDDVRSMIAKDRNHASVIMYSIGNEIAESGTERGIDTARRMSDFVRDLDPERPTTLALNFLLNFMAASGRSLFDTREHDPVPVEKKQSAVTSTVANVMANKIGGMMQTISKLPKSDKVSRDTFKTVDVAGYNYAWGRYAGDAKRHPHRVVLGTESMPGDITKIWPIVESTANVIGDFVWTGWDYLGESGIGTWTYGSASPGIGRPYPELVAGCGLVDIVGTPGAAMLLSQAVWNLLESPQIAVRPMNHAHERVHKSACRSTDAVRSWAWAGSEGKRAEIQVYSTDEYVELILNGRSLGRKKAGAGVGFVSRFRTKYEPGELTAIGYRGGVEVSRSTLTSAAEASVHLRPEASTLIADGQDLSYVWVEIADADGIVEMLDDDTVTISIAGPAELVGFGSAATATTESFTDVEHSTWRGRALAVVRSTGEKGVVVITATSQRHGSATTQIAATES
jgi:beta-galactosidase